MFFLSWTPGASLDVAPARWTGLTCSWDTVGLLGIVFGHQATLSRLREVVVAACLIMHYHRKSTKTMDSHWFLMNC